MLLVSNYGNFGGGAATVFRDMACGAPGKATGPGSGRRLPVEGKLGEGVRLARYPDQDCLDTVVGFSRAVAHAAH